VLGTMVSVIAIGVPISTLQLLQDKTPLGTTAPLTQYCCALSVGTNRAIASTKNAASASGRSCSFANLVGTADYLRLRMLLCLVTLALALFNVGVFRMYHGSSGREQGEARERKSKHEYNAAHICSYLNSSGAGKCTYINQKQQIAMGTRTAAITRHIPSRSREE
jgi:hypothetical protein